MSTFGKNALTIISLVAGCCFLVVVIVWLFSRAFLLPEVFVDANTGDCVWVYHHRGAYTCETLPRKYIHTWVAPGTTAAQLRKVMER